MCVFWEEKKTYIRVDHFFITDEYLIEKLTICCTVNRNGASIISDVSRAQRRAVSINPIPGSHSGNFRRRGKKSTRKEPGIVALLKFSLARSMSVTKG